MKKTYKIICLSHSGKEIPTSSPMWYGITPEQMQFLSMGICVGLKAQHKRARVEVYEKQEHNGETYFVNVRTVR